MSDRRAWHLALIAVGAITLLRVVILFATDLQLYPDEAQYWWWSVHPDWGYFSKPPMIAWVIAATTAVLGDGEAAIRIASPLLHGAIALTIFAIARPLYDARTALWSSLAYLTLPGISYSSLLISTDVPLLFFWSVALLAFITLTRDPRRAWLWAILCGVAIGLGCLSKYAMLYFVLGAGLAAVVARPARRVVLSVNGLIILAVAALVFTPNILWNVQHQFATVQHTAANANWSHAGENLINGFSFIAGQFGVMGPILMAAYLYGAWQAIRTRGGGAGRLLLCFSAPILLIVTVQGFISEANANWAAPAYVAAVPLAVHTILTAFGRWALWTTAAISALVLVALTVFALSPASVEAAGLGNAFKRFHGWRELGTEVVNETRAGSYSAVIVDNRSMTAALLYYARPMNVPVLVWDADEHPDNHFQMTMRLEPSTRGPFLVASDAKHPERVLSSFDGTRLTRTVSIAIGGGKVRTTNFFVADGYRGPSASNASSR